MRGKLIPLDDRQLTFKLTNQTVGAQRAYRRFLDRYGLSEGRRIFLAHANELGEGSTIRQRVNDVYKTGATVRRRSPRKPS